MEEESDRSIGECLANHLWHEHQMVVVDPDWKTREYNKYSEREVYVLISPSRWLAMITFANLWFTDWY
jgi:hypothetical protein